MVGRDTGGYGYQLPETVLASMPVTGIMHPMYLVMKECARQIRYLQPTQSNLLLRFRRKAALWRFVRERLRPNMMRTERFDGTGTSLNVPPGHVLLCVELVQPFHQMTMAVPVRLLQADEDRCSVFLVVDTEVASRNMDA